MVVVFQDHKRGMKSGGWKYIIHSQKFIKENTQAMIGGGDDVMLFQDPWLASGKTKRSPRSGADSEARVKDIIMNNSRTWDEHRVRRWFNREQAIEILNTHIRPYPERDKWVWKPAENGRFSIKISL